MPFFNSSLSAMRLPIQVQGILFTRTDGEIWYLLLKRIPDRGGFWQPVTGGVEEDEAKVDALKREVMEETGLANFVRIVEDVDYFEFWDFFKREARQCLMKEYVFGVEVSAIEKVTLCWEHSEHRWCSFEEALKLLKWKENKEALKKLNSILSEEGKKRKR